MNLVVCIDDNKGMTFNHRRVSQDRLQREDMLRMIAEDGVTLWVNEYTFSLFSQDEASRVMCDNDFLNRAMTGDYCFVENEQISESVTSDSRLIGRIDKLIIYRWNRKYPSDKKFDVDMNNWKLTESYDFAGSSHDKITKEIYER